MIRYSDLKYLSVPLPEDVAKLKGFGDFARMERVIDLKLNKPGVPECLKKRLELEKEIIRLMPDNYPYDFDTALGMLREAFGAFEPEELDALRDTDAVDWAYIGGQVHFKDDFLPNLIKTRSAFADRLLPEKRLEFLPNTDTLLADTVRKMIAQGGMSMRFTVRHELKITNPRRDEKVRVWLPIPKEYAQCRNVRITALSHEDGVISPDTAPQRTVYFEAPAQADKPFFVEYTFETHNPYIEPKAEDVLDWQPTFYTEEYPPHILFTPYLRMLAGEIVGQERNPLLKARKIYDFITTKCTYSYMREYITMPQIPEYMASSMKGDCGVQALLFITLCRICKIPARWQSGIYVKPYDVGSHDWAQFYVEPYGWLFADCSFGGSAYRKGDLQRWNFYFGNLEPYRMPANSEYQHDFRNAPVYPRRDPYDNQTGEAEYESGPVPVCDMEKTRTIIEYSEIPGGLV